MDQSHSDKRLRVMYKFRTALTQMTCIRNVDLPGSN